MLGPRRLRGGSRSSLLQSCLMQLAMTRGWWMRALGCSVRPNLLLLLSGLLPRPRSYPGTRSAVSPTPFSVPLTWLLLLLLCRMVAMLVAPVPTVAVDLEPTRGCCLQTGSGCWRLALPPTLAKLR